MMRVPSLVPQLWFLLVVVLATSDLIVDRQDVEACPEGSQKLVLIVEVLVFQVAISTYIEQNTLIEIDGG